MNHTQIKVGGVPEHFNTPWYMLSENNSLVNEGIHLDFIPQPGGTGQMIESLVDGDLDLAVLLTEGITAAILKGAPLKIIRFYVNSPLIWGLHVNPNRKIANLNPLKEQRFAISRLYSGSHLMAHIHADSQNQTLGADNFVIVHDLEGAQNALATEDAEFFLWEKYTTQPLVDSEDFSRVGEVPTPWPCFVIAVREDVLNTRESEITRVIEAIEDIITQLEASPEETIQHISKRFNLNNQQVTEWFSELEWT